MERQEAGKSTHNSSGGPAARQKNYEWISDNFKEFLEYLAELPVAVPPNTPKIPLEAPQALSSQAEGQSEGDPEA